MLNLVTKTAVRVGVIQRKLRGPRNIDLSYPKVKYCTITLRQIKCITVRYNVILYQIRLTFFARQINNVTSIGIFFT